MNLTTTGLAYLLAFSTLALSGNRIAAGIGATNEAISERQQEASKRADMRQRAMDAKQLSAVALARVSGGCIPMVVKGTDGQPVTLQEGMPAFNTDGQPLDSGIGCSADGSTAEIWQGGVYNIARVAPADRPAYDELFSQQR